MSTCRRPGPSARRSAVAGVYSMVTRSWLMRRVLSRPLRRVLGELGQVLLVGEARHAVVGLRLEVGARDAPLGHGGEERQPPAGDEVAHQRGDEDGLARARQPGDAQPHGRRHQIEEDRAGASEGVRRRVGEVREPHRGLPFCALRRAKKGAAARSKREAVPCPRVGASGSSGLREGSDPPVDLQRLAERGGGEAASRPSAHARRTPCRRRPCWGAGRRPDGRGPSRRAEPRSAAAARRARRRAGRAAPSSSCAGHRARARRRAARRRPARTGVTCGLAERDGGRGAWDAARLELGRRGSGAGAAAGGSSFGSSTTVTMREVARCSAALFSAAAFALSAAFCLADGTVITDDGRGRGGVASVLTRSSSAARRDWASLSWASRWPTVVLQAAQVLLHLAHGVLHVVDLGQRLVGDAQPERRVDGGLCRLLCCGMRRVDVPGERGQIREPAGRQQPPGQEIDPNEASGLGC